jgi:hypothetical protein
MTNSTTPIDLSDYYSLGSNASETSHCDHGDLVWRYHRTNARNQAVYHHACPHGCGYRVVYMRLAHKSGRP